MWFEDIVKRYASPGLGGTRLNPLPNRLEMIRLLAARGADIEARSASGKTPLFFAAYAGDAKALRLLLELGADPNATDNGGMSPLMAAMCEDKFEVADALLAAGAEVDARNNCGVTPLMRIGEVPKNSSAETARLLIAAGADVRAKDNDGRSVCDRALGKGAILDGMTNSRSFFLSVLATQDLGLSPSKYKSVFASILPFAVMDGNAEAVRAIFKKAQSSINSDTARDAFYAALVNGSFDMVRLLVELYGRKIIIPRRDSYDTTALGALLESDHPDPEIARLLITLGADPDEPGPGHKTPLEMAAAKGSLEIVRLLVGLGAEADDDVYAAAAATRSPEVVLAVCGNKAGVARHIGPLLWPSDEEDDDWGEDWDDDEEERKPVVRKESPSATTPKMTYADFLRWVLDCGAKPSPFDIGEAMCNRAAEGDVESVRILLDLWSDDASMHHLPLMSSAVESGSPAIVRLLAGNGVSVDSDNSQFGITSLQMAESQGNTELVRTLLELGADPKTGSPSPIELALENHNFRARDIVELLLDAGATATPAKLRRHMNSLHFPKVISDVFAAHGINLTPAKASKKRQNT